MSKSSLRRGSAILPVGNLEAVLPGVRRQSVLQGGPMQIVYGNERENIFQGTSKSRSPVVFVGGDKGDTYRVAPGQISIVADLAEAAEPGDDDKPDTLDLTPINRSSALWGYIGIGNDILMTDVVSGMATLLRDPFGKENAGNAIERVKAQYRDPVTGVVDPSRSQFISMADWLSGGSGTLGGMLNLGPLLQSAAPGAIVNGVVVNYDAYNAVLTGFRALGGNLQAALEGILPITYDPAAPLLARLVASLPITSELGLPNDQSVQNAWTIAARNLDLIG